MKRTAITKKKTKRLSAFDKEFTEMKELVVYRSRGLCEVENFIALLGQRTRDQWPCDTRELHGLTQVHHRKYRSRGGTNSPSNLIAVCDKAHLWIHLNPELSNKLGLSLHAGESEEL